MTRRLLLLCALALALSALTGCNVVAMRQASIEGSMHRAGLAPSDLRAGPDTIHYWVGGHGPTVVLVHGFGASGMWQWYQQVEDLAKDHRVVMPDLLWFGDSSSEVRDYSLDHQVHAVEALLDHLGEHQVDVMGVSYGGLVAHELASDRAGDVRRLVIVDSPGRVYTRDDYRRTCGELHVESIGQVLVPRDTAGVTRLLSLAYYDPPWVPGFALQQTLTSLYSDHREERAALLEKLLGDMEALTARPVTLRARPAVIWGLHDPVFPVAIGRRLADKLGAPFYVVQEARHTPNMEHPEEFNRIVRGFLAGG